MDQERDYSSAAATGGGKDGTDATRTGTGCHTGAGDVVQEHRRHIDGLRAAIGAELAKRGHQVDADVRIVDGQAVMMFILPSTDYIHIGFGPTGGQEAYRGPAANLRPAEVARKISAWVADQQPALQRTGTQVSDE